MNRVKLSIGWTGGGWVPDVPDPRDLRICDPDCELLAPLVRAGQPLANSDLQDFFTEVDDQSSGPDSAAISCGALLEYFNRRCRGMSKRLSTAFLHHVACRLSGVHAEGCLSIRNIWKTVARTGVPPESYLRATHGNPLLDDPLLYAFAKDYYEIRYFRVVPVRGSLLDSVKLLLHLGIPSVFGMPVATTLGSDPRIDYRPTDEIVAGAAGVFVGHDDDYRITTRGALRFRSSWGSDWGESGYGWISYRMVEAGMIRDIWTIFSDDWFRHGDLPIERF